MVAQFRTQEGGVEHVWIDEHNGLMGGDKVVGIREGGLRGMGTPTTSSSLLTRATHALVPFPSSAVVQYHSTSILSPFILL